MNLTALCGAVNVAARSHHGNHWMGGTPTQYLSTALASVSLSSSYVSSHSTFAKYFRDLPSFWWRHACR